MKVAELQGAMLDYWVARAEGVTGKIDMMYMPSTDWATGGPIIDREKIEFGRRVDDMWGAWIGDLAFDEQSDPTGTGPTHLIAAMRAFVASKLGEEVPDSAG
jgi:hypothetical protein